MHEGSITQSIVDSVIETLDREGVKGRVTAVHVTVGVCQGLVPESMGMFFDMVKPDTPLAGAELVVHVQGMVGRCERCGADHDLDIPVLYCPECGEPMDLVHGQEILVTSIEVENEEGD